MHELFRDYCKSFIGWLVYSQYLANIYHRSVTGGGGECVYLRNTSTDISHSIVAMYLFTIPSQHVPV